MNFKNCPNCGFEWEDRDSFLNDKNISMIGYQVNFVALEAGFLLFNHVCKGTFALEVERFRDLYDGPVFEERATGSDACPGYCQYESMLGPCPTECECRFVREIIQILKKQFNNYSPLGNLCEIKKR